MTTHTMPASAAPATKSRRITASPPESTLPIYTRHLVRSYLRTGVIWTVAFGLFVALIVLIYPSFRDSGALDAIENYPEGFLEAFGVAEMTSVENFVGAEVYSYAPLVLVFFPIMTFSSAIAGAEERRSLDILLGNPMPRRDLVLATWIAMALILLGVVATIGLLSWLAGLLVDAGLGLRPAMAAALNLYPITMAFGSLALLLSAVFRSRGLVIGITFAAVFLFYLLDITGKIATDYDWLRWLSPFRAYGNAIADGFPWIGAAILLIISIALLAITIPVFNRREIYT